MKLGFVLKITNGGESEAYAINKSESWARYASDARSAVKELSNFDETEKVVYLTKFLGAMGYLIGVIKARPQNSGRPYDNTAAWIYFPANADVSNVEMIKVLQTVEEAISETNGTDFEKLELLFRNEYSVNTALFSANSSITSKNEAPYGIRYFGNDYNLHELMGGAIAQQEYGNCKGVFFVDQALDIQIASNLVLNFEPKRICTIQPLAPVNDFRLNFLVNNEYVPFDRPIEMIEGQQVEIYWCKKGYRPIAKTLVATQDNKYAQALQFSAAECMVRVKRSMFRITNESGKSITNADIFIDRKKMIGEEMGVAEDRVRGGVTLLVTAPGHADYKKEGVSLRQSMDIKLKSKGHQYEFVVPMYDGKRKLSDAVMTFNTARTLHESPLKGYEVVDGKIREGKNKLEFKQGLLYHLQWLGIGFLAGVLLVLAIWGICSLFGEDEKVSRPAKELVDNPKVDIQDVQEGENQEKVLTDKNPSREDTRIYSSEQTQPDANRPGNSNRSMTDRVNRTPNTNAGRSNTNNKNAGRSNTNNKNAGESNTNNKNAGESNTNNKNAGK